jgi:DnaJ-class molecular chaperone
LQRTALNHYATFGLDRDCTSEQIRAAYRLLAKQLHPDVNGAEADALAQTQRLNAAYEILSDPAQRRAYDAELARAEKRPRASSVRAASITQDHYLRIDEFLRGARLDVRINDPANSTGPELHALEVPPNTAPGTRFKIMRNDGSKVIVRVRVRPDHRFKSRGSDLRSDLRISPQRAAQGGAEFVSGPTGTRLRVEIPRGVARGDVLRIPGEGLPKARGGRGDLLLRVLYRPDVRISRASNC